MFGSLLSVLHAHCEKKRTDRKASLTRVLSRVHVRLSEETRLEKLADPGAWGGFDENDPKSAARVLKRMTQEMGEDTAGEVDQLVEEAMEAGDGSAAQDSPEDSF